MTTRFTTKMLPLCVAVTVLLSACGAYLPASGPTAKGVNEINVSASENPAALPKVEIIDVDDALSQQLYLSQPKQSLADLGNATVGSADVVNAGDVLEIGIWESPPALLFGGALNSMGSGTAQHINLPPQMVSESGKVSVPFLGAIVVRGKTPEQIQKDIVSRLKRMANQPQALVRVAQNHSANVTVIGAGKSVRMPLTPHRERVLDAIAAVGGTNSDVRDVSVQFTRQNQVRTVSLEDLTESPSQNIYLRPNDVITLKTNPLSFTAFGALGRNQQFRFSAKGLNLGEALSTAGGLLDNRADASGVFVFRHQPLYALPQQAQQNWLAQGYRANMEVPVVYRLNLRNAQSLFWLQRFPIQDKDMIYVANAPASELQKFLHLIFSPIVGGANSVQNLSH
ncbi:polysaccharide biosynthesis/export family protein [Alysiella filiformis]|nr:polysaccharide biosynthesis/export family protein [Alysiella filiformis]UBQ56122.1 polysaccharide export protein [Alysiella filiformis DSM 16848]